jgi:hypothetical protein
MQLDANNTEMLKEWDPNMPVELLFTQIEEGLKKALKLQVKQAGELPYLSGICNCTTGFANVSLIAMLNHLFTTYNTITLLHAT